MLLTKNDPTCVKMIDFGLSKDFTGQDKMSTMSGSVSKLIANQIYLQIYSHTILLQKYFYKTTILKLIFGLWEWFSTLCFQAKFRFQVTLN